MVKPSRKDIRLQNWDYASNATYHITFCTKEKRATLGYSDSNALPTSICLSPLGELCKDAIEDARNNVEGLKIHIYTIMPNHVHALLSLKDGCKLSKVVTRIKAATTRTTKDKGLGENIWQRGYYDHIIRGESDFKATWDYIESNPAKWENDELHVG